MMKQGNACNLTKRRAGVMSSAMRWGAMGMLMVLAMLTARAGAEAGVHWNALTTTPPWGAGQIGARAAAYDGKMWVTTRSSSEGYTSLSFALWSSADGVRWTQTCSRIPAGNYLDLDLVTFQGKLWAVAVNDDDYGNPCVLSTTNGTSWTTVARSVPWSLGWAGTTAVFNNRIYVITWSGVFSSSDGATWTKEAAAPPGLKHGAPIAAFAGKLWILGGGYGSADANDTANITAHDEVWCSSDGRAWTLATAHAGWGMRGFQSVVVHDGKLWVAGGQYQITWNYSHENRGSTTLYCNDIWSSSDGIHWEIVNGNASDVIGQSYELPPTMLSFAGKLWSLSGNIYYSWLPPGAPKIDLQSRGEWNQTINEGIRFVSPRPALTQGTMPVTWQLGGAPTGMSVNPNTGVITWPATIAGRTPYVIRLRAVNAAGVDDATFTLTVSALPGPRASTPPLVKGDQTTLTWSSAPSVQSYTIQRDDARDFATPLETIKVSTATLKHVFTALAADKTYWYRVRADRATGLSSPWSNVTSCTQDASPPEGWITSDNIGGDLPPVLTARLVLHLTDPGASPSGISQVRVSPDQKHWSDWKPYAPKMAFWLGQTMASRLYVQVSDCVGNTRDFITSATIASYNALYVDDDNTSGPWTGALESPYRTIQAAIDAARTGRVIVVAPGRYRENINFRGKDVILRSADPQSADIVRSTIIDGQQRTSVVRFGGSETAQCVLAGFTITNGNARGKDDHAGGGILGNGTHAAIRNNRIVSNRAYYHYSVSTGEWYDYLNTSDYNYGYGGGIANCHGLIENNVIAANTTGPNGIPNLAGISPAASPGKPLYPESHYSEDSICVGSAIYGCNGIIQNNTIWNNIGGPWGHFDSDWPNSSMDHGAVLDSCTGIIRNNIFSANSPNWRSNCATPTYCCGASGATNITADPRLANPWGGDFHLLPDSPCIDAGAFVSGQLYDMDGDPRGLTTTTTLRGDGSHFDIGADEYQPPSPAILVQEPHGGEELSARAVFRMQFVMDPARAGTKARMEIRSLDGKVAKAWSFPAPGGALLLFQHLPDVSGQGYRLRVISESNPALYAESAPFTIRGITGVAPEGWRGYE